MQTNQMDVVKRLAELSRMLDKATDEVANFDRDYIEKKSTFEKAYASAFLQSTGSMDIRRYEATLNTADLKFTMEAAEQVLRACKERINTLRAQISIGQTLSAAMRQQFSAEGIGQL